MPGWKMLSPGEKDGAYSWLIAISLFLVNCIDDGILKSFGVLLNSLSLQYTVEVWVIGTTVSVMCFFGSSVAMMISPLVKQVQPRLMMMICGCLSGLGFLLASISQSWTLFAVEIVLFSGIGLRCSALYIFSYLQIYFDRHYTLASALLFAGRPIGTMVFAPITQALLYGYGVRGTMLVLGAITFHIALVGAILKPQRNINQHLGNEADIPTKNEGSGRFQRILQLFQVDLFRKPTFLSILTTFFAGVFGFQAWIIYLVPHAIEKGLMPYEGTALATSGGIGQLFGYIVAGHIVDEGILHENKVRLVALIITGISFAADPWCDSFLSLLLLSFIFGFGVASISPVTITAAKNLTKGGNIATILGYLAVVSALGRLIGGSASGWLYDQTGSYDASFLLVGGVQFAAAIIQFVCVACLHQDDS